MTRNNYEKAFDEALRELDGRLDEREVGDERIMELRDAVFSLAPMLDRNDDVRKARFEQLLRRLPAEVPRLSEVVRDAVYYSWEKPLSAMQVRDIVIRRAPELRNSPNLLANIHTTLKRLVRQGELKTPPSEEDVTYVWAGPTFGARKSLANTLSRPGGFTAEQWHETLELSRAVQKAMKTRG